VLIPTDCADNEESIVRLLLRGERVRQIETFRVRKTGERFPVAVTFSPIRDVDHVGDGHGAIVGVSRIVRDLTEQRAIEASAARERHISSSLVDATPGIFYLYDERGKFVRWNRSLEEVSGYTSEEIAHIHPLELFTGDDRERVGERIAEVFSKGASSVEASLTAKDKTSTPYFFTGKRIVLDGEPHLLGVGVDVTDRVAAQVALAQSEARYRSTLDSILEGCQLLDFDWRYLYLNEAAAKQNRRPNRELLGNRMPDMWPGIEETAVFKMLARTMAERVALHEEIEFVFPDGSRGAFDVRSQPVPEGVFVLSVDITERKRAERALRELNE